MTTEEMPLLPDHEPLLRDWLCALTTEGLHVVYEDTDVGGALNLPTLIEDGSLTLRPAFELKRGLLIDPDSIDLAELLMWWSDFSPCFLDMSQVLRMPINLYCDTEDLYRSLNKYIGELFYVCRAWMIYHPSHIVAKRIKNQYLERVYGEIDYKSDRYAYHFYEPIPQPTEKPKMDTSELKMKEITPYFATACYGWIVDSGYTPFLVAADKPGLDIPPGTAKDGFFVANIGPEAVVGLKFEEKFVSFTARFNGVAKQVFVPMHLLVRIFPRENPAVGMDFHPAQPQPDEQVQDVVPTPVPEEKPVRGSHLRRIK